MPLDEREKQRYSRQIAFPKIGEEGQEKLKQARVAILGLGAIGSPAAVYLASAGVGYIRLIDRDYAELSNIQRQILYNEEDAGEYKPKAVAAKEKLEKINSDIVLEAAFEDFNPSTAERLVGDVDIVLDGTDNMEARFLLNEVCIKDDIPFIYGAAIGDYGVVSFIVPGETPCLKCIIPEMPEPGALPTCEVAGVLGPAPGIVGMLEAVEVIKYFAGFGNNLRSKLLYFDLSSLHFDTVDVKRDLNCSACVRREFPLLTRETRQSTISTLCGRNAVQISPKVDLRLDLQALAEDLRKNPEFRIKKLTEYLLIVDYDRYSIAIAPSGRAIVHNTDSEKRAKSILNRIISY
jgi:molybdopterin/thiamine biosynthesis adenylyltransferase